MKDVATVHDGFVPQTNIVRTNGARRPADRHAQRQGVDARRRQRGEGHAAKGHVDGHRRTEAAVSSATSRCRAVRHRRRRARDADRGAADGIGDPAVPRQLAQHPDRLHLDSAVDPHVDHHPGPARPDHQRDDARRAGARRRYPRGRCDRGNREHTPEPRDGQAAGSRGARRRVADRRADVRVHARHLHRVRPGAAADRDGAVPVHAAGDGGGLRDDGVICCRGPWCRRCAPPAAQRKCGTAGGHGGSGMLWSLIAG